MIQVKIKNTASQQYTHGSQFESLELAQAWIDKLANHPAHPWGKPEHQEEILDEQGLPFVPPQYETVPSEFAVEIEDITTQVAQEQINAEAQKFLNETDWFIIRELDEGTPCPADIKAERAAARARIVR